MEGIFFTDFKKNVYDMDLIFNICEKSDFRKGVGLLFRQGLSYSITRRLSVRLEMSVCPRSLPVLFYFLHKIVRPFVFAAVASTLRSVSVSY